MEHINLGCGSQAIEGWTNVDLVKQPGVDIAFNLDEYAWPFSSETAVEIRAHDVFEHVNDPLNFMSECWRILKPGAILNIHTTYWKGENSYTDPTHKRFCTEHTFDYWIPGTHNYERYGIGYSRGDLQGAIIRKDINAGFGLIKCAIEGDEMSVWLAKGPVNSHYAHRDGDNPPWQ